MRTLLIDNYDSYSHILAQYVWEVFGDKPIIVKNDRLSYQEIRDLDFDGVIISPGPGHPDIPTDFGVCRAIIEATDRPILGVCLGHQGLAACFGGKVVFAPKVMHGKYSRIAHDGSALFAGIPSGFRAVRYHSLLVEPAAGVKVTARTMEDGLVMGLQIEGRPFYGVQFHPESIGTEHGRDIIENFRRICESHRRKPSVAPRARVTHRELPWLEPDRAFSGLFRDAPFAFWLDSSASTGGARFSFMGRADTIFEARGEAIAHKTVSDAGVATAREERGSFFQFLQEHLREREMAPSELPFDFTGGLVGYFGYELKDQLGLDPSAHGRTRLPDGLMMAAADLVVFDHVERKAYACTSNDPSWLDAVAARWQSLPELPPFEVTTGSRDDVAALPFELSVPRDGYLASIGSILEKIHDGETYEACLTNELRLDVDADPFRLYRVLRTTNPAPYSAYLQCLDGAILSSSPECFLKVDRAREVTSEPIKGTRRRGATAEETLALRNDLARSGKDHSELLMIIDLIRNDLGRVCQRGSVRVEKFMQITEHATVLQMSSVIRGALLPNRTALDAVESCFPGGSITGAPKHRTCNILDALEKRPRGVYTGSIGYLSYAGPADLNIAIRTMTVEPGAVRFGAGGGIVAESDPADEFEEICVKAHALLRAVNLEQRGAFGTMRLRENAPPDEQARKVGT